VLITGCSSGIGRATAKRLAERRWKVYATARRPESIADLAAVGCEALALDVTDEESMRAAVSIVEAGEGAVGALVNNAGYSQSGAVETIPMDRLRAQFETNVLGLVRMCQLVLPGMRRAGRGRIVNVSSMGGRLTFPGGGAYHATRGRGALGRASVRGRGIRRSGGDRGAGADHDRVWERRRGVGRDRGNGRRRVRQLQRDGRGGD
jgi:NAD(P)-dependent dehydrogenase (short-subunit alcohol dehydrogenase family)